jgi:serine/threonine protein kinase
MEVENENLQNKNQVPNNYLNKSLVDNRFILLTELGRGAFSKVWRSIDIQTTDTIALKIFFKSSKRWSYKR